MPDIDTIRRRKAPARPGQKLTYLHHAVRLALHDAETMTADEISVAISQLQGDISELGIWDKEMPESNGAKFDYIRDYLTNEVGLFVRSNA